MEYVEISSKCTRQRDSMDRERIAARRTRKRRHPKRHGVGEEKSQIARRKHAKAVKPLVQNAMSTSRLSSTFLRSVSLRLPSDLTIKRLSKVNSFMRTNEF